MTVARLIGSADGSGYTHAVRETELWERLASQLGRGYHRVWAAQTALPDLDSRTVDEALVAGIPCKTIWRAVWKVLELPASER